MSCPCQSTCSVLGAWSVRCIMIQLQTEFGPDTGVSLVAALKMKPPSQGRYYPSVTGKIVQNFKNKSVSGKQSFSFIRFTSIHKTSIVQNFGKVLWRF